MHDWGEEDFDWKSLDEAINYIHTNLVRYGRINVLQSKEKFGTARIYCFLGFHQLHNITHPGYAFSRYPKWLWRLDVKYLSKIIRRFNIIVFPYHKWLYRKIYSIAVKKWPHIHKEITCMADYPDLLKGI